MILVKPSFSILTDLTVLRDQLKTIELAGRTCYKSEDRMDENSYVPFVDKICNKYEHESVIEHSSLTVKFIIDRGVSHELVRHRLAAFSQESTRYCNYTKDKFSGHVTFIIPEWLTSALSPFAEDNSIMPDRILDDMLLEKNVDGNALVWVNAMNDAERSYNLLIGNGWTPQQARAVLPNSLKTEIVVTANFREWRHILKMRTSVKAHPQMREVMVPLLDKLKESVPVIFDNINLPPKP